jgi:glycerophosphoryl diester phosphodiesterase
LNRQTQKILKDLMSNTGNIPIRLFFPIFNKYVTTQFNIQGHRGARGHCPENTIAGFLKAIAFGVHTIELDVVISADRQVVVSHEAWMNDEICSLPDGKAIEKGKGIEYNLYRMPYEKIKQFDCGKRQHPEFPRQVANASYKPLLSEVIIAVENYTLEKNSASVCYNIEIKTEEQEGRFNPPADIFAGLVCSEIGRLNFKDRVSIQSFDITVLQEVRKINTLLKTGFLTENQDGLEVSIKRLGFNPTYYNPEFTLVNEKLIKAVHERGIKINPWTVNDKHDMERLIIMGVDGIISDYPDRLVETVKKIRPAR